MIKICFTGHRPVKLYGYNLTNKKYKELREVILEELLKVFKHFGENEKYHFITGGALGLDTLAFDLVDYERETLHYSITQEIAIPFKDQPIKWFNNKDVKYYNDNLNLADKITYVDKLEDYKIKEYQEDRYYPAKMQKRNEYMVDNSDIVIVVWSGIEKGGTWNCVKYARKQNKKMIIINPNTFNIEYIE